MPMARTGDQSPLRNSQGAERMGMSNCCLPHSPECDTQGSPRKSHMALSDTDSREGVDSDKVKGFAHNSTS